MESTFNDSGRGARADATARDANSDDAKQQLRDAGRQGVNNLTSDVQDLLGRVAHVADPEIARLRSKIERGLTAAKSALANGSDRIQRNAKSAMSASDTYVHEQPWQAVGIAAAAGLVLGFLIARR